MDDEQKDERNQSECEQQEPVILFHFCGVLESKNNLIIIPWITDAMPERERELAI